MTGTIATVDLSRGNRFLLLVTMAGTTMLYSLTMTLVNITLPQLQGAMSASQDQISWVVTLNVLAMDASVSCWRYTWTYRCGPGVLSAEIFKVCLRVNPGNLKMPSLGTHSVWPVRICSDLSWLISVKRWVERLCRWAMTERLSLSWIVCVLSCLWIYEFRNV